MIIEKDEHVLKIHNSPLIELLLSTFGMEACKGISTPLVKGIILNSSMSPESEMYNAKMANVPYRQLIGGLLHLSITVRPDISFAVGVLSRYIQNSGEGNWKAGKRVLRYLRDTSHHGIVFEKNGNREIQGYCDADFADDLDDRKSTTGIVFMHGGAAISWRSKTRTIVAQSTLEAEYVALATAIREAIWIRGLISEATFSEPMQIQIYSDSQGATALSKDNMVHERSEHIDIKYHLVRDHCRKGIVALTFLGTGNMIADILNKPLSSKKHSELGSLRNERHSLRS